MTRPKKHIQDCLNNNWVTMGPKTKLFEEKWAQLFNYPYTVAFNSGTSADMAACMALYEFPELDAKPGDEIICPALSFIATANSIRAAGFIPKFVDVNYETLNIDVEQVGNAITNKTKAVMSVNLMGKPCRMDTLDALCTLNNIPLIIDNCEAYGCRLNGRLSLEYSSMETTSMYVAHICCSGEGGTVSCRKETHRDLLQSIRSHGREPNSQYFNHLVFGFNLRPTDLHMSIGLGELENFGDNFQKRKANLYRMRDAVKGFEDLAWFVEEDENAVNAPHAFSITLKPTYCHNIEDLKSGLDEAGIHHKRNFGSQLHHKCFSYLQPNKFSMPRSRYIGNFGIHIGCHQFLTEEDLEYICQTLKKIFRKMKKN